MFATLATHTNHSTVLHRYLPECVESKAPSTTPQQCCKWVAHMHKIAIIQLLFKKVLGKDRSQKISVII